MDEHRTRPEPPRSDLAERVVPRSPEPRKPVGPVASGLPGPDLGRRASKPVKATLKKLPPPPPVTARRRPSERAQIGLYGMNWDTDLVSGDLRAETPSGGGAIFTVECGLGGIWSLGYSQVNIGGDLPGYQADLHVNCRLPGQWTFQIGPSMGEVKQFPGGPMRNDFVGTSYSLIKSFRLSPQWRFQASYTNVPVRDYLGNIQRPIRARASYHLLTVSYSPSRDERRPRWAFEGGLLRFADIRPIGFSYLFGGVSYRFRVPRLLR